MFDNAVHFLYLVCRFLVEVGLLGERRPQFDVVVDAGGGEEGRRRVRLHAVHHVLKPEHALLFGLLGYRIPKIRKRKILRGMGARKFLDFFRLDSLSGNVHGVNNKKNSTSDANLLGYHKYLVS